MRESRGVYGAIQALALTFRMRGGTIPLHAAGRYCVLYTTIMDVDRVRAGNTYKLSVDTLFANIVLDSILMVLCTIKTANARNSYNLRRNYCPV
jgi:hypothetical protein